MPYQRMTSAARLNRLDEWITLHMHGVPYTTIARDYNVSDVAVRKQVVAALEARVDASVEQARAKQIARCEYFIEKLSPAAEDGDEKASDVIRKWMDQLSRLTGTNAVVTARVEHSFTDGSVDDEIAALTAELAHNDKQDA